MKSAIFSTISLLAMAVPAAMAAPAAPAAGPVCETSDGSPTVSAAKWAGAYWGADAGRPSLACQTDSHGGCITVATAYGASVNFCSEQAACKTVGELQDRIVDLCDRCEANGKVGGKWDFGDGSNLAIFHS
ncbi:hypothetical protein D9611_014302 [Ephemerocybe angulata]|uniref:Uncharacterized protein n=1 Tax=Ephemerocybe angulata TaxID=980116 RepID=A0A8H5F9V4_9AGAR|nr:hypothetical protein D9611_014302 [Tulosesus angulatus]